jgi:osmotically-inducible protein OsmY
MLKSLACIGLLTAFAGCAGLQNKTAPPLDDAEITAKVTAAIQNEPTLKGFKITIKTFKGNVLISGYVDSPLSVTKAAEIVNGVTGVISLNNDLMVK